MSANTRFAIIGTAESWKECPWDDPGLTIISLNDAYQMKDARGQGLGRIDEWYDLHPLDRMWFRPKDKHEFKVGEIPEGVFVRPEGHIEWMQERAKTMFVSPYHIAYVHTGLGELDAAIDLLEKAVAARTGPTYGIKGSFLFLPLQQQPRFLALLREMKLA